MGWLYFYIIPGALNAILALWLVIWKDAMGNPPKREPFRLEEVTLGGLLSTIGCFFMAMLCFPIVLMMTVGMLWDSYNLADIVLWKKNNDPEKSLSQLKKKASKLGFSLQPKIVKGVDDV